MARKGYLDPGQDDMFGGSNEGGAPEDEAYVYDSMTDVTVSEEDGGLELLDIAAMVDDEPSVEVDAPTSRYELVAGADNELEPTFDGVIDANVTLQDDGASLAVSHAGRQGGAIEVASTTPEIPLSTFGPGVLAFHDPDNPVLSQFRLLKIQVEEIIDKLRYRSIAVTSTRPGEGRTSTAVNLAVVMSENPWLKIALVDLNFKKPDLIRLMQAPEGDPGLLQVLSGRVAFERALKKLEHRNLYFLHTGGQYDASMNVLNSPQFDLFLNRLYEAFDLVIVDCPAVTGSDEALIIKQKVDGVFMVLKANTTPVTEMNKAATRLGKDRILGVVLNGVPLKEVS